MKFMEGDIKKEVLMPTSTRPAYLINVRAIMVWQREATRVAPHLLKLVDTGHI
jgi:hypothetical protein